MADAAAAAAADVPTAAPPLLVPAAIETSFPASAPPATSTLAPPLDYPSTATGQVPDTDMPQATIPQSDGPGDDPMDEVLASSAPTPALLTSTAPAPAVSGDTVASSVATAYAMPETGSPSVTPEAHPVQGAAPAAPAQAPAPGTEAAAVDVTVPEAPVAAAPATAEELISDEQIKAAWLSSVDEVYSATKEEWQRRKPFEDAIKRPYFHVKPLDLAQLQNWSRSFLMTPASHNANDVAIVSDKLESAVCAVLFLALVALHLTILVYAAWLCSQSCHRSLPIL